MSAQLESNHFFRSGDTVRASDGRIGVVIESGALYAIISWGDGARQEVDQFDPAVAVLERAPGGA